MKQIKDIKDIFSASESDVMEALNNERKLRKKKPYKSRLRPFLPEIKLLREKYGFEFPLIQKWLRVNKRIKVSEETIRSFYHRNKNEVE
ncbi:hypothetical protein [Vibrio rotiferianus]|uniref:hypothetical protein n=1 Tax=Vibrio rotiferianus TaxID=190895 RepID=UPI0005F06AB7|nr:hypothetical protein [Vibrio rotiferianus]